MGTSGRKQVGGGNKERTQKILKIASLCTNLCVEGGKMRWSLSKASFLLFSMRPTSMCMFLPSPCITGLTILGFASLRGLGCLSRGLVCSSSKGSRAHSETLGQKNHRKSGNTQHGPEHILFQKINLLYLKIPHTPTSEPNLRKETLS